MNTQEAIKKVRNELGLTRGEASKAFGIRLVNLNALEDGIRVLSTEQIQELKKRVIDYSHAGVKHPEQKRGSFIGEINPQRNGVGKPRKAIGEYASPDELIKLRKKLCLSQKQCEKLIGKNRHWWAGHEKGIVRTRREYLDKLQAAFDALSDEEKAKICMVTIPEDEPMATPEEMLALRTELGLQAVNCSRLLGMHSTSWWRGREISSTKTPKHFLDDLRSAFDSLPPEEKARLRQWNNTLDSVATQKELIALRHVLGLLPKHCDQLLGKGGFWWQNHERVVKKTPRHILEDLRQAYFKLPESTKKEFLRLYIRYYA